MVYNKIQILGPFNSGTNLISKILNNNLSKNIKIHPEGHTVMWKHSISKSKIINNIHSNPHTLFICVYKPLHNWICSMRKKQYDIIWNKNIKDKCKFRKREYTNIIDIYNTYYNMYIELINKYERVTFINYYDILNKNNIINYLSNKLSKHNLDIRSNNNILSILDRPAKTHGKSVQSSKEALNKKQECFNQINKGVSGNLCKKYLNYEIEKFFENK